VIAHGVVEVEAAAVGGFGFREVFACMVEAAVVVACWAQVPVAETLW
jgi:hypothetical protein